MAAVTLIDFRDAFPEHDSERKAIAREWLDRLLEEWFNNGLPGPETFHVLVHPPGHFAASPEAHGHVTHVLDQAAAEEVENGKVAVAITLSDVIKGAEEFEAWRIRQNKG